MWYDDPEEINNVIKELDESRVAKLQRTNEIENDLSVIEQKVPNLAWIFKMLIKIIRSLNNRLIDIENKL